MLRRAYRGDHARKRNQEMAPQLEDRIDRKRQSGLERFVSGNQPVSIRLDSGFAPSARPGMTGKLLPLHLLDFIAFGAAGGDDLDLRALALADQRLGERRGDRDAALLGVGLRLADDLPYLLLVGILVDQRHGGAEGNGVARKLRYVDHVGARQLVFQLGDAALVERLLLLGGVIFGVLRQVAVRARVGDLLNDARPLNRLAVLEFGLERRVAGRRHWNLVHRLFSSWRALEPS